MSNILKLLIKCLVVGVFFVSLVFNIQAAIQNGTIAHFQQKLSVVFKQDSPNKQVSLNGGKNQPIAYFLNGDIVFTLDPVLSEHSKTIPQNIVIPPGIYTFSGKNYSLLAEGLYRLVVPGKINVQRVVYRENLDAFLSAICWMVSHGNADDSILLPDLTDKAMHSKVLITCGTVSRWARELLLSIGVDSRIVSGITVKEWNDFDNGHILLEVWRAKWRKWVVYDFDNNCYFLPLHSDIPLSIVDLSTLVTEKKYRIRSLANDTRLDVSGFRSANGYDYSFFSEGINADIKSWYARVLMVPCIYDDKQRLFIFMDEPSKKKVESYSPNYKYMEKDKFMSKYYDMNY